VSVPVLMVPGWQDSGPGHWQSLWQSQIRGALRVEMPNWDYPDREAWVDALEDAIASSWRETEEPPVLVGHSVGCIAIVHWATRFERPIAGALLVAPADVERLDCPKPLRNFAPVPRMRLPFPSRVVASDNDTYLAEATARGLAASWGAIFTLAPGGGHMNTASGYGEWPAGEALLQEWLR